MKKRTIFFFLALLYLLGFDLYAQKVESPSPPGASVPGNGYGEYESAPVVIYGEIKDSEQPDSIFLEFYDYVVNPKKKFPDPTIYNYLPGRGSFRSSDQYAFIFELPKITTPSYIWMSTGRKNLLEMYMVMPGDSVKIIFDIKQNLTAFSGPAGPSFECQYNLNRLLTKSTFENGNTVLTNDMETFLTELNFRENHSEDIREYGDGRNLVHKLEDNRGEKTRENLIASIKKASSDKESYRIFQSSGEEIKPIALDIIRTDYLSKLYSPIVRSFYKYAYSNAYLEGDEEEMLLLDDVFDEYIKSLDIKTKFEESKYFSAFYTDFFMETIIARSTVEKSSSVYEHLNSYSQGRFKAKAIARYLVYNYEHIPLADQYVEDALGFLPESIYKEMISELYKRKAKETY